MAKLDPDWDVRRSIVIGTVLYCAANISYIIVFGEDTKVNETALTMLALLAKVVIMGYVFGVVADEINKRKTGASNVELPD